MQTHVTIGWNMTKDVKPEVWQAAATVALEHHERWDGTGYPDKMKGEAIPMTARIVNVADTWDACTSTRPYQEAMSYEVAMGIMRKLSGTQCDPTVVDALHRALEEWKAMGKQVTAAEAQAPHLKVVQSG
jgi:HD-GYP domain-containing protein (c-di-GMP phosphodiesterase class II)